MQVYVRESRLGKFRSSARQIKVTWEAGIKHSAGNLPSLEITVQPHKIKELLLSGSIDRL
jgi:hypothetical protein